MVLVFVGLLCHCSAEKFLPCTNISATKGKRKECKSKLTILHNEKLEKTNEEDNLSKASLGDGIGTGDGGKTIREGVKGVASEVDVAGKVDAGAGDDLAEEGKLGDTAVLELDVTEALEASLVGIVEEAERIVESEGLLGSELLDANDWCEIEMVREKLRVMSIIFNLCDMPPVPTGITDAVLSINLDSIQS